MFRKGVGRVWKGCGKGMERVSKGCRKGVKRVEPVELELDGLAGLARLRLSDQMRENIPQNYELRPVMTTVLH